ncbi:MAG: hypothetical protein ABSF90_07430 [Syntrophobacteraceae bacterium]|jgi:hypothetical protein
MSPRDTLDHEKNCGLSEAHQVFRNSALNSSERVISKREVERFEPGEIELVVFDPGGTVK